MTVIACTFLVC